MKYLKLTNTTIFAQVDDEDFDRCLFHKWNYRKGVIRCMTNINKIISINLSNFIMGDYTKTYDHKDRNFLNNTRLNLRECTRNQNMQNRGKLHGDSKYKGVSKRGENKYQVRISYNGRTLHLGIFETELKAAQQYDFYAKKYHKEFAVINFPEMEIIQ
jgi:hypothetical protein